MNEQYILLTSIKNLVTIYSATMNFRVIYVLNGQIVIVVNKSTSLWGEDPSPFGTSWNMIGWLIVFKLEKSLGGI